MYQSYLNFILRHVKFELVLEDFKYRQVINFEEVLQEHFGYLKGYVVSLKNY